MTSNDELWICSDKEKRVKKRTIWGVEIKHGVTKRGVIMLWGIAASIVIYAMSIPINAKGGNLFFNYASSSAILFGGGAAYHMVSLMADCPQTEENYGDWLKMVELLIKIFMGFSFAVMCLGIGFHVKGYTGVSIVVIGYFGGFFWSLTKLVESHKYINSIKAKA